MASRLKLERAEYREPVLEMASIGRTVYQIADEIGVSHKTVRAFLLKNGITPECFLNKPDATGTWYCRDCSTEKDVSEFGEWRPGRPKSPCRKCTSAKARAYANANKEKVRGHKRHTHWRRKKVIIDQYGGKCQCCGEGDIHFLTIDHANDDGKIHRQRVGEGGAMYLDIVRRGFPKDEGLRVLCYNCNIGRRAYTCCPHNFVDGEPIPYKIPIKDAITKWRRTKLVDFRKEVISEYGCVCSCCGENNFYFLVVDHVNGNGHIEKKAGVVSCGTGLLKRIKSLGFPKDSFQVLCYNCNSAKGTKQECPHNKKDVNPYGY